MLASGFQVLEDRIDMRYGFDLWVMHLLALTCSWLLLLSE